MSEFNHETGKADHSEEIAKLREEASGFREMANEREAAAGVLEVHDLTGLSLDNWSPRAWVEDLIGHPITENHV